MSRFTTAKPFALHAIRLASSSEEFLDTGDQGLILFRVQSHSRFARHITRGRFKALTLTYASKKIAHLDVVYLTIVCMQLMDNNLYFGVFGRVVLQVRANAFSVEGMQAWINKELSIVKD